MAYNDSSTECERCGHTHKRNTHTCGWRYTDTSTCECKGPKLALPPAEAPPQPERRPPLLVAYSVAGHLYEVAVSGDATVSAVDGALIIQHSLGPVAGIVHVAPLINEESA
jgi:hypothetical protein